MTNAYDHVFPMDLKLNLSTKLNCHTAIYPVSIATTATHIIQFMRIHMVGVDSSVINTVYKNMLLTVGNV